MKWQLSMIIVSLLAFINVPFPNTQIRHYVNSTVGTESLLIPTDYKDIPFDVYYENLDTFWAAEAGRIFFNHRLSLEEGGELHTIGCTDCHQQSASGFSEQRLPGSRGFRGIGILREKILGLPDSIYDQPPVRTPTFLNAFTMENALWDGSMGCGGFNEGLPDSVMLKHIYHENCDTVNLSGVFIQARKGAFDVHNLLISEFVSMPIATPLIESALGAGVPVDEDAVSQCITIYEQMARTCEAPFQRWLRGDDRALPNNQLDGIKPFIRECHGCHNGPSLGNTALAPKLVESTFPARKGFTGNPLDEGLIKVPQLYNLKDSPFLTHTGRMRSLKAVIIEHQEKYGLSLSNNELRSVVEFVRYGLYDPTVKEYNFR